MLYFYALLRKAFFIFSKEKKRDGRIEQGQKANIHLVVCVWLFRCLHSVFVFDESFDEGVMGNRWGCDERNFEL